MLAASPSSGRVVDVSAGLDNARIASPGLAVGTDAGNLNHRRFWYEPSRTRRIPDRFGDSSRCRLTNRSAFLADQKNNRLMRLMTMHACDEGISALYAMDKLLFAQEVECAIHCNRRRPRAANVQPIDQLVSAQWSVACQKRLQHLATHGGQSLLPGRTDCLGMGDRIARAAPMIVTRFRKNRVRR